MRGIIKRMKLRSEFLRDRLDRILELRGMTARQAGLRAGGAHIVQDIRRGRLPRADTLAALARVLDTSSDYLLGLTDLDAPAASRPAATADDSASSECVTIPLVEEAACDRRAGDDDDRRARTSMTHFPAAFLRNHLNARPTDLRAMVIRGDSMIPMFQEGDCVLIDTRMRDPAQPGPFAIRHEGSCLVRILEPVWKSRPPRIRLRPRNEFYASVEEETARIDILGRIVWFGRRL